MRFNKLSVSAQPPPDPYLFGDKDKLKLKKIKFQKTAPICTCMVSVISQVFMY